MLDDQKFFRDIVERTNYWHPTEEFEENSEFLDELEEYLSRHLNGKSLVDDSDEISIERKNEGLEIDNKVYVLLEKDFSDKKEASKKIEEKIEEFDYLLFVSCGVKNVEDWRDLEKNYIGTRERKAQLDFVWKSPELYGVERKSDTRGEDPLGGLMDEINKGVKNNSDEETEE